MIKVDTRENEKYYKFLMASFPDVQFNREPLAEGDYASEKVICERKTVADLYMSIVDRNQRFSTQVDRLSLHDDKIRLLLITGSVSGFLAKTKDVDIRVNDAIIYGSVASVACRYGFQVLWIDDEWTALVVMVKFMIKVDKGQYLVPSKNDPDILAARLLGLTPLQYVELRRHYGSIQRISQQDVRALQRVFGIGPKKAQRVIDMLTK